MGLAAADRIRSAERKLLGAERILLTALIVGMTLLGFLQIVLRKVFSGGFLWADTFLRHLVLWIGFLGAALAVAEEKHFGGDIGDRFFSGRLKSVTRLVVHLFAAVVCAFLTQASVVFIRDELRSGRALFSIGGLRVPASLYEIILPVGFLLLACHYVLKSLESVLELRK
jgi:TRAP-type C4-dicarboxylate transport system permease small subunit